MTETAQKLRHVMPAPFVELGEKIARLAGKEDDIIDLTQGISRIQLTEDVVDRISGQIGMVEASRYSSDQGLPGLREQVARRVGEKGQIGPDSVIVTPGANQATFIALSAILEPGNEVILPAPFYFNNEMAVRIIGGIPKEVPLRKARGRFDLNVEEIENSVSSKTCAIILITPNNPTGAVFSRSSIEDLLDTANERDLWLIVDETYREFVLDQEADAGGVSYPPDKTIKVGSFSKSLGLAGWRIGYLIVPEEILPDMLKIQDSTTICAPVISQIAAGAALESAKMARALAQSKSDLRLARDALEGALSQTCLEVPHCSGAFYLFPSWKKPNWGSKKSVTDRILDESHVGVVPGVIFGKYGSRSFRISFGSIDLPTALEAGDRLRSFFEKDITPNERVG